MQQYYQTERLRLATIKDSDFRFLYEILHSPGWLRFIGDRKIHTEQDAKEYITGLQLTEKLYYWVISCKSDQQPIGIVSFLKRNWLPHFDIGFALLPHYEGKGYAYEATQVVLKHALQSGFHLTVFAITLPENERSINLLNRLGFVYEEPVVNHTNRLLLYKIQQTGNL